GFAPVRVTVPRVKALPASGFVTVIVVAGEVAAGVVTGSAAPKSKAGGATSMPNFLPVRSLSCGRGDKLADEPVFPIGSVTEKRLARPPGAPVKEFGT